MGLFGKPRYTTIKTAANAPQPSIPKKTKIPPGIFEQCKGCGGSVHKDEWKQNLDICPLCDYHRQLPAYQRVEMLLDEGSIFQEIDTEMKSIDILKFEGAASYEDKLKSNRTKTGLNDSVICGTGNINGIKTAIAVMDFRFLGASMGSVVGEKITRITELATKEKIPLVIVTASGGARMYEGMFSLMQMAKTSGAIERHKEASLAYIVVMTHPTTAGVSASFATLGDIIVAEPKALIGFAGPRVIKDTTQATLPEGFQLSEFLLEKGLVDRIIHRKNLKLELGVLLEYLN